LSGTSGRPPKSRQSSVSLRRMLDVLRTTATVLCMPNHPPSRCRSPTLSGPNLDSDRAGTTEQRIATRARIVCARRTASATSGSQPSSGSADDGPCSGATASSRSAWQGSGRPATRPGARVHRAARDRVIALTCRATSWHDALEHPPPRPRRSPMSETTVWRICTARTSSHAGPDDRALRGGDPIGFSIARIFPFESAARSSSRYVPRAMRMRADKCSGSRRVECDWPRRGPRGGCRLVAMISGDRSRKRSTRDFGPDEMAARAWSSSVTK